MIMKKLDRVAPASSTHDSCRKNLLKKKKGASKPYGVIEILEASRTREALRNN
jgi:hypothetical protein